jgi:hypothetical protein
MSVLISTILLQIYVAVHMILITSTINVVVYVILTMLTTKI